MKPSNAWSNLKHRFNLVDDEIVEVKDVVVHTFRMGDVEDPDLYAAEPMWAWQQSDAGKWVMENAVGIPEWHRHADPATYGWQFTIVAKLTDKHYTYWALKWG